MTSAPICARSVHARHRAERRDRLEVLAVRLAVEREEVIPAEDRVDAELLGLAPRAAHALEVGVLGLDLDTDAHRGHESRSR